MDEKTEIEALQADLLALRQHFIEYAERKSKRQHQQKLESLDKLDVESEMPELPYFSLDNVKDFSPSEVENLKEELKKHIKLMQILIHKANCPISRIIDKI